MYLRCTAVTLAALGLALCPALRADDAKEKAPARSVRLAHIKLSGSMDEKPPQVDPLLGPLGETFKGRIDRIRKARGDREVDALLLEINGLSVGWGKLHELSRAIDHFRTSGKKVYAYVESGESRDFLLALSCDQVCLPEATWLMLTGLRLEATFYKDLLEKVGIKADMLQMGDFKGAAEPYTRTSLSEANRTQLTAVLDDFFTHEVVGRIVKTRAGKKLTTERVRQLIDEGPHSARAALAAGLIDRVEYLDGYLEQIKAALKGDTLKLTRDYGKKKDSDLDIFSLYRKLLFGPSKAASSKDAKVAVIYASGPIMTGKSGGGLLAGETVGSETLVKAIQQAEEDKTVKAIVLRVDSPGGSALASDLIWNELKRSKKPVIASMSDVAASGGYYISMAARKIYAEPGTLTGSIGVVGGKLALRGVYDKIGIKSEVISRGKKSGLLTSADPFSPSERQAFRKLMEDTYDQFLNKALQGRQAAGKKVTREELVHLAGGRVWTGRQAKANGLIDELGTLEDAIAAAAKLGGIAGSEPELLQLPKPQNPLEALFGDAFNLHAGGLEAQTLRGLPELAGKLRDAGALLELRREPVWAILPQRIEVK